MTATVTLVLCKRIVDHGSENEESVKISLVTVTSDGKKFGEYRLGDMIPPERCEKENPISAGSYYCEPSMYWYGMKNHCSSTQIKFAILTSIE